MTKKLSVAHGHPSSQPKSPRAKAAANGGSVTEDDDADLLGEVVVPKTHTGRLLQLAVFGALVAMFAALWQTFAPTDSSQTIKNTLGQLTSNLTLVSVINNKLAELFPPEQGVEMGAVGKRLREEGLTKKHPVLLVPGFTTSGLEVWTGQPCMTGAFRTRMWTSLTMIQSALLNGQCWMDHMRLDTYTNLDPPGVRLRPAEGMEAGSYFLPGFYVWGMIVENLAAIGYDNTNMMMAPNDWRLSYGNMQERDHLFDRMRHMVEYLHGAHGEKVLLVAHSMGAPVMLYFFRWIESKRGGNAPGWVDQHVHALSTIGGVYLGIPKAVSALLSGEMKDTSTLGELGEVLESSMYSRRTRRALFRSWHSLVAMLPKGGDAVWGNSTWAPDDSNRTQSNNYTYGQLIRFTQVEGVMVPRNRTADTYMDLLTASDPDYGKVLEGVSAGTATDFGDPKYADPKHWYNTLEAPLPDAPHMRIYCLYGVGKETERAYMYKSALPETEVPQHMASGFSDDVVSNGVLFGEGDGTVPLLSLGYTCVRAWKPPSPLNPANISVVTREYVHNPHPIYPRGGESSGDHVDIMGNVQVNEDILRLAAGQELSNHIFSNIEKYAENIHRNIFGKAK